MQHIQLSAFGTTQTKTEPDDTSRTQWSFHFETLPSSSSRQYFVITGIDLAGNPVEGFRSENPVTAFPVRQDNNVWIPQPTQQSDSVHYFQVAAGSVSAAFTSQVTAITDGLSLQFTNQSTSAFTSSHWIFGDGATSTETNPQHLFATSGSFDVKLTVTDCSTNSVSEVKSYVTILPYITKLEIKDTNKDSVISIFERKLVNNNFVFTGRQKAIDAQTDVKITVYTSGHLKNLGLVIKSNEGVETFQSFKQETEDDSVNVFEFVIPRNKLSAGTNYMQIQGTDFAGNQLLKQKGPLAYPYLLKEGTSLWSADTLGYTGIDSNYSLYVKRGKLDNDAVILFPNPTSAMFYIECGSKIQSISIFSLKGALIDKINMNNYYREINVSGYPAGVYIVIVKTLTAEIVRKISIFR
jgi:PKD repeat protein